MSDMERLMPYRGARGLLTGGVPEMEKLAKEPQSEGLLAQALANVADAATVMVFGSPDQQAEVRAWMDRNRQRSQT